MKIYKNTKSIILSETRITENIIGSDLLANLDKIPRISRQYSAFLLLSDSNIFRLFGNRVVDSLKKTGIPVISSIISAGENSKLLQNLPEIIMPYLKRGITRKACLINLGGGVISDIGGFIASILLRGIDFINLPTTLLAQIDASIGGKNGLNFLQSDKFVIKNILGSVKQPVLIISDIEVLKTLPENELLNGLGEMVKYYIGWGTPQPDDLIRLKSQSIDKKTALIISECQKIKMNIVKNDPLEKNGLRQKLNLGHTVGHALESASGGALSHGQAVAIGLIAAAKISRVMGLLTDKKCKQICDSVKNLGLPVNIHNLNINTVIKSLKFDKKGGTYVLIRDIGKIVSGIQVEPEIIMSVLKEIII